MVQNTARFADAIVSLYQQTHASVVISAAAIVDSELEESIKLALRAMTKTQYAELFGPMAPLGSFASKIRMAYALNIITKDIYRDLESLRKLRNAFAHSTEAMTHLGSDAIAPLFNKLTKSDNPKKLSVRAQLDLFLECVKPIGTALSTYKASKK